MARDISWIRAARKDFLKFPQTVRERMFECLEEVSEGFTTIEVKPLANLGSGVF